MKTGTEAISVPVFCSLAGLCVGELVGGAFCAGGVPGGGTAAPHLNGGEGADAFAAVVVEAAVYGALDAGVGFHVLIHGKDSFRVDGLSMPAGGGWYTGFFRRIPHARQI